MDDSHISYKQKFLEKTFLITLTHVGSNLYSFIHYKHKICDIYCGTYHNTLVALAQINLFLDMLNYFFNYVFQKKKILKENENCFEIFKDYFIFVTDSSKIINYFSCVEIAPILPYYHNIKV